LQIPLRDLLYILATVQHIVLLTFHIFEKRSP